MFPKFPCWRYHETESPRIFKTEDDLLQAGDGWHDSPAKVIRKQIVNAAELESLEQQAESLKKDSESLIEEITKPKRARKGSK